MSRIQSDVGLVTGINIKQTVDQLMAVAGRPRKTLEDRTRASAGEKSAIDTLSTKVLALKLSASKFTRSTTFTTRTATSSDPKALSATVKSGASVPEGSYKVTPLRTAAAHQVVSTGFASLTGATGVGELRIRFGGHVDKGRSLVELNGGDGFKAGKIRVTDRSGETATIDLRAATSADEIVEAINSTEGIGVRASIDGDRFVLTDTSGGTGTLRVQESAGGTTAASLGLAGVAAVSNTITGGDVVGLGARTRLDTLNDGLGVGIANDLQSVDDLAFAFRDGSTGGVDLSGATTLGDVVARITTDTDLAGKVTAAISSDGKRLELTDLSSGTRSFKIENGVLGTAADDLGLSVDAVGGKVTGRRLVAGLRDTLVSTLGGRDGLNLAAFQLTDRAGVSATVNLAGAETVGEVVDRINAASPRVTAKINDSRNGIELTDNSGGSGSLVVGEVAGGKTAAALGLVVNGAVGSVRGGDLRRQTVGAATPLAKLNQGQGAKLGDIRVFDSTGKEATIDLDFRGNADPTLGDAIRAINAGTSGAGVAVQASINDAGDGIVLTDSGTGIERFRVEEVSSGTTAKSLRIAGVSTATNAAGNQVIDGATSYKIDLSDVEADEADVPLATLRGGLGITPGTFLITDSTGKSAPISTVGAATVGDVLDRINAAGLSVTAAVNEAGTGIRITEDAVGPGGLKIEDLGTGSAAAQLRIEADSIARDPSGKLFIESSGLFAKDAAAQNSLQTIVKRVNELRGGFSAALVFDGFSNRLSITSDSTGAANELSIDGAAAGLSFSDATRPADAVALFGPEGIGGFAVTSSTNNLNEVVPGLNVSVLSGTGQTVSVNVAGDRAPITSAVKELVESYNSIRTSVAEFTKFDAEELTTGLLFGRNEVLRVDVELSRVVTERYSIGGERRTLEAIGLNIDDKGKLTLDESKLNTAYTNDPAAVEALFTNASGGVVSKINTAVTALADGENSLLARRSETIQRLIDTNNDRLEVWDERLARRRTALENQYFALEELISQLQTSSGALNNILPISLSGNNSN
ncbi:MAG: flagellar filament capping protein FliD [Lacipirellulaceae bacterium]